MLPVTLALVRWQALATLAGNPSLWLNSSATTVPLCSPMPTTLTTSVPTAPSLVASGA